MRPLALAAILAVLTGCSLPYQGKTFTAIPKPKHMAEGEGHELNPHGEAEEGSHNQGDDLSAGAEGAVAQAGDRTDATAPLTGPEAGSQRVNTVFPITAQPTGRPPVIESPEYVGPSQRKGEE